MIRHRSKFLVVVVLLVAVLLLGGCSGGDAKIGFIAPLSGPNAGEGRAAANAFQLAFTQADKAGKLPVTVEIMLLDDEGDVEKGTEAVETLLKDGKVMAAAGFYNTPVAESTISSFVGNHCPLIIWGTNAKSLTTGENYPYVLRALGTEAQENVMLTQFICGELDKKRVYIISENSPVAVERAEDMRNRIVAMGGALKGMSAVLADVGETELNNLAAMIVASGADVVYYTGDAAAGGRVAMAVKQAKGDILFCTTSGVAGSAYITAAGKAADGTIAVRSGIDLQATEAGKEFVAAYEAAGFEEPLGVYSVQAYHAAQLIISALQEADNISRSALTEKLTAGSLTGLLGDTTFGLDGQALNAAFYPVVYANGGWQSYALLNAEPEEE